MTGVEASRTGPWTTLHTRSGLEVRVRKEIPGDAPYLLALFESLSPDSRFLRFSKVMDDPNPEQVRAEAERLADTALPPIDSGWLAFVDLPGEPETPIASVRYVLREPGVAELAISVRDDLQRQGIGTRLLQFAMEKARQDGIRQMVASFRSNNRGVWRLLRRSPYPVTLRLHGSEAEAIIDLTADRPPQAVGPPTGDR